MNVEIVYSPLAKRDLETIWNFIGGQCENPNAADRTISKILDTVEKLAFLPESDTPLDARCLMHSEHRFAISGNYLDFYRFSQDIIFIDRILDSGSDYLSTLFGITRPTIGLYV